MATIENLGAAYSSRLAQQRAVKEQTPRSKQATDSRVENLPSAIGSLEIRRAEEADKSQDASIVQDKNVEEKHQQVQRISLEELTEMLRKVNLTFDLFEIQTTYTVDQKTGEVTIQIINQRTGEVIRKIPPYDVRAFIKAFSRGESMVTDVKV